MMIAAERPTMPTRLVPDPVLPATRSPGGNSAWAIVLAGGEGTRLRSLVQRIHSDGRPKQYAILVGERSLLRQTLDRVALAVPPERTVVVQTRAHSRFFPAEFSGPGAPTVLVQPQDRGTAAGILLPALRVAWKDPGATVAVFPSDHFVADDGAFMRHVVSLLPVVDRHPELLVLLGAAPDSAEPGYGWIEPGPRLDAASSGEVRSVRRFVEKPSASEARACLANGSLWNTFVMLGRARTLVEAMRRALPELVARLARIRPFVGTPAETRAIEQAYRLSGTANFSQTVLVPSPARLAVSPLPALAWSDWGTPERVIQTLRREGLAPAWLRELATTA
jgi:mannose-1-phosphate guanylyltransferase